jgi:Leucine-rich repeat (LRR) protein
VSLAAAQNFCDNRPDLFQFGCLGGGLIDKSSLSITTIPSEQFQGLPATVTSIHINDNMIQNVPADLLMDIPNLQQFYAYNNMIASIDPNFFANNLQIFDIDLSNNNLQALPGQLLGGLSQLRYFYVSNNQLSIIEPGFFQGMINLEEISLAGNNLVAIPENTFVGLPNLQSLYLGGNPLIEVPASMLSNAPNLDVLTLPQSVQCIRGDPNQLSSKMNQLMTYSGPDVSALPQCTGAEPQSITVSADTSSSSRSNPMQTMLITMLAATIAFFVN